LAGAIERAVLRDALHRHRNELHGAIQWMSARLDLLPSAVGQRRRHEEGSRDGPGVGADALTKREREVLELLAGGSTNAVIAEALHIGEGTVKYHVKNVLRKLGATSRADAVARALRIGRA
jgi:DNA-binding NarL/FixJ family response regulator